MINWYRLALAKSKVRNPWEMAQEEFIASVPAIPETSELLRELNDPKYKNIVVALMINGEIRAGKPNENHSLLSNRLGVYVSNWAGIITGFYDTQTRKFYYQYPDEAHKWYVAEAIKKGYSVPYEAMQNYPQLLREYYLGSK